MFPFIIDEGFEYVTTMYNANIKTQAHFFHNAETDMCHVFVMRYRDFDKGEFPGKDFVGWMESYKRNHFYEDIYAKDAIKKYFANREKSC